MRCLECGKPVPRGMRYTCGYKCKRIRAARLSTDLKRRTAQPKVARTRITARVMSWLFKEAET